MKRLPFLLLIGLVVMWLLLNDTVSVGHVVLGSLLALLMVLGFRPIRPDQPRVRRPLTIVRLLGRVLVDIVRSNLGVARIVLGLTGKRQVHSGFVHIPLDMRDPHGLAALSAIVTPVDGIVDWQCCLPEPGDGEVIKVHTGHSIMASTPEVQRIVAARLALD